MTNVNNKNQGITLIALVVTIVVLLILAGISISMLTGQNGILNRAAEAKENNDVAQIEEQVKLSVMAALADGTGELTVDNLKTEIAKYGFKTEPEDVTSFPVTVNAGGKKYTIDEYGSITEGQTVSQLFDSTGEVEGKLHIGDFVNYSLGNWDDSDFEKIAASGAKIEANGSADSVPNSYYQFGGFAKGASKSGNAKPYDSSYAYVKDSDGNAITGWRVFDVEDDGTLTLISAGCPEDYCAPGINSVSNGGYISEYILTGNKNSNALSVDFSAYTPRDWSMYVNTSIGATKAEALTKARLDSWYTKYITNGTAANTYTDDTFRQIYGTKYESLIDNYSSYWLSSATNSYGYVYRVESVWKCVESSGGGFAFGVRVLVSLPSRIILQETSVETKEVISRENKTNYSVWNFAQ